MFDIIGYVTTIGSQLAGCFSPCDPWYCLIWPGACTECADDDTFFGIGRSF